jgi:hypothetical protein
MSVVPLRGAPTTNTCGAGERRRRIHHRTIVRRWPGCVAYDCKM